MQMKPKGVTIQVKALDEYVLMVMFVLLLKRVHFLAGVTTQMKALDEYILMVMFVLLLKRVHVFVSFVTYKQRNMAVRR